MQIQTGSLAPQSRLFILFYYGSFFFFSPGILFGTIYFDLIPAFSGLPSLSPFSKYLNLFFLSWGHKVPVEVPQDTVC